MKLLAVVRDYLLCFIVGYIVPLLVCALSFHLYPLETDFFKFLSVVPVVNIAVAIPNALFLIFCAVAESLRFVYLFMYAGA